MKAMILFKKEETKSSQVLDCAFETDAEGILFTVEKFE